MMIGDLFISILLLSLLFKKFRKRKLLPESGQVPGEYEYRCKRKYITFKVLGGGKPPRTYRFRVA